jgi:HSP20 family protein
MHEKDKRSFFERLTGTIDVEEERAATTAPEKHAEIDEVDESYPEETSSDQESHEKDEQEGELAVDVYTDGDYIYVQAMIAGVEPENIDVDITREEVTLRGKRVNKTSVEDDQYYHRELYWGGFSRKITLPEEIDPDKGEALEKHGLLILRLPKLNKSKSQKLEVKSVE